MNKVTVASQLNDKNLRKDFPHMRDETFEHAIRIAVYVSRALSPESEEEKPRLQKQYFLSFLALRRVLPRPVMMHITLVGPKLMDFMSVVTEVSGLAVVHQNNGLWFFDMRGRNATNGGYPSSKIAEHYATITPESQISQFSAEDEDGADDE